MNEHSSDIIFADWDKYCDKAREILIAAGLNGILDIEPNIKERSGDVRRVAIQPFPCTGNKEIIKQLDKVKDFHGYRKLGYDNRYQYHGYIEIKEV